MRLDWSEVRARAAAFSERFKDARYEKGETQTFYNEFFACFGVDRRQVATYELRVRSLAADKQGFIDLFMPGTLLVEQKSAGRDLGRAQAQALDYYDWLPEGQRPRYILTCDFQRWHLVDLETRQEWRFGLADLKHHIDAFAFIVGVQTRQFRNQKPVNPKASQLLGQLHERLADTGYDGHKLQLLLVRLLFILFADDTGIWPKDQFLVALERGTSADGRDLGRWLAELFQVLNTPEHRRVTGLDPDLAAFPYINGRLFEEPIPNAVFSNALRDILLEASAFNWGSVSPAIFGSLFESVIDKVTRRAQGAHYTPEEAIQKVLGPLFLDDLWAEFKALEARKDGGRSRALEAFHDRLASLTFLDPACGAGNFLVVAYRELRELERELLKALHPPEKRQLVLDVALLSKLNVDQFHGLEIDEFPSQIAQVALWMTDHIANVNLGEDFGRPYARVPLVTAPNIRHADALETDWNDLLPAARCSYVLGNPPFVGQSYQSPAQRTQMRMLMKRYGRSAGSLDYVGAWFLKAAAYANGSGGATPPRIGFVSTNSICQGEQVAQLWPLLFDRHRMEISFAHRTFVWPGKAAVHCVIVGLITSDVIGVPKRLFNYIDGKGDGVETRPDAITAYLFGSDTSLSRRVVEESRVPLSAPSIMRMGSKIVDGGYYIFNAVQRAALIAAEPAATDLFVPLIGSKEFIQGRKRWMLDLKDVPPATLRSMPLIQARIRAVREFRSKSTKEATRRLADVPLLFEVETRPQKRFLVVPEVSSERRSYIPLDWVEAPAIPTNLVQTVEGATTYDFAILTSAMHMAWLRHIGGRLKSDYRYSIGLVYNTFPWPDPTPAQRAKVEALAQAVLDARALPKNAASTLADLYDPDTMPAELRKAHRDLDAAVDRLYAPAGFADDRARVEHLFRRYEALVMPTTAAAAANRRTARRVARTATAD